MAVFNIYCDESSVENKNLRFMVIGSLFLPRNKKQIKAKQIKKLLERSKAYNELKWSKTTRRNLKAMELIVDYILGDVDFSFRFIVVDKKKIDFKTYHENDEELAFFKFYYLMLRNRLLDGNSYYIFLDKKPTRERNRIQSLSSFLKAYVYKHRSDCSIKHIQAYSSNENVFIQLIDLLTGAVAYSRNHKKNKTSKTRLLGKIEKLTKNSGLKRTSLVENKLNIFEWMPKSK